jgi:hypothetical protein
MSYLTEFSELLDVLGLSNSRVSVCVRYLFIQHISISWLEMQVICTLLRNIAGYCCVLRVKFVGIDLERKEWKY